MPPSRTVPSAEGQLVASTSQDMAAPAAVRRRSVPGLQWGDQDRGAGAHHARPGDVTADSQPERVVVPLGDALQDAASGGQSRLVHADHYAPLDNPVEHGMD